MSHRLLANLLRRKTAKISTKRPNSTGSKPHRWHERKESSNVKRDTCKSKDRSGQSKVNPSRTSTLAVNGTNRRKTGEIFERS